MRNGIDLGGSHVAVGLVSEEGKLLVKKGADILQKYKEEGRVQKFIIDTILEKIDEIFEETGLNKEFISQIGIATPGIYQNGCILHAVNLGIEELAIESKIQVKYHLIQPERRLLYFLVIRKFLLKISYSHSLPQWF